MSVDIHDTVKSRVKVPVNPSRSLDPEFWPRLHIECPKCEHEAVVLMPPH